MFTIIIYNCFAQTKNDILLIGKVGNSSNQLPIELICVALNDSIVSYTNNEGLFSFEKLSKGSYSLSIKNNKTSILDTIKFFRLDFKSKT